ncbi:hypothetical protein F3Y22_tig00110890pilonHSYRG00107 [Hibiscus syriacus]|uniref:Uncharacterized protein n=1 Tax=Hibiscus syriacus TaxID=106335 RepID=A0A6A2ZGT3_HIBSY|nr:hypothetical protein F3Y22_tig00110890pilonHSYRG00107 [Hibiscus syriacus]
MMENSSSPENNSVVNNVSLENEEEAKVKNEESERNFSSGNRWPRQETLALLKMKWTLLLETPVSRLLSGKMFPGF